MPLHVIVHDFDEADLMDRVRRLKKALPEQTRIEAFSQRSALLEAIAKLEPSSQRKPLLLVDLHADRDDMSLRGERLLRTIELHHDLRGRTVIVAFTRYGYTARDERLKALGATAVLNPSALKRPEHYRVFERLELLNDSNGDLARIGTPPTLDDEEMIDAVEDFFPNLRNTDDDQERLLKLNRWLLICRLDHEGYERKHIMKWPISPPVTKDELDDLRRQLRGSRAARGLQAQRPGAPLKLGDVAAQLFHSGAETAVITDALRTDEELTAARLESAVEELESREPLEREGRDLWIPVDYVEPMRMLLTTFNRINRAAHASWSQKAIDTHTPELASADPAELRKRFGTTHPTFDQNRNKVDDPLHQTAEQFEVAPDALRTKMTHAVACLEEAAAD